MEKPTPVFADGLFFNKKRDGAPDYIKGSISIEVENFTTFLKNNVQYVNPKGYITIDLKQSQKGTLYFQVNTYKANMEKPTSLSNDDVATLQGLREAHNGSNVDITAEEIPF